MLRNRSFGRMELPVPYDMLGREGYGRHAFLFISGTGDSRARPRRRRQLHCVSEIISVDFRSDHRHHHMYGFAGIQLLRSYISDGCK